MKKTLLFSAITLLLTWSVALGQFNEYYMQIDINDRSELEILTQIVSIDNVVGKTVYAYANDNEFDALKKRGYSYKLLPHPSSDPSKVLTMATTVQQMANWDRYPTYPVYVEMMQNYAANYPNLCKLDTIGTSVQGRLILTLKISDNAQQNEAEPQLWYSSTIHGDETTGWILMLRLIDYLLTNYGTNERVTNIVNNLEIYISPNTNPDGTFYGGNSSVASARRYNYDGTDLNRDFPDPRSANSPYAHETQLMMNYATTHHFILGANFHGGIELVNYPWDTWTTAQNPHADHNWFYTISRQYADLAQANSPAGYMTGENNGVTQGGDWYVVMGGRQDYMNYFHHCKEVTIELSNTKLLSTDLLPAHWNYNRESLLTHIENALYGIHGFVTNPNGEPLNATITVVGHDKDNSHAATNPQFGKYIRMLLPGTYTLRYEAYGYIPQTVSGIVVSANTATIQNVVLQPANVVTVTGTVYNATNGQPLPGVSVSITNSPVPVATTNANGAFSIAGVMEGDYEFVYTKTGFITKRVNTTVSQSMSPIQTIMEQFTGISFEDGQIPNGFSQGNYPWTVVQGTAYDGNKSLQSGTITHNQTSSISFTFNAQEAGTVSFFVKVSSESNYDKFKFFIDNVEKTSLSGEVNWTEKSFAVTAGQHTLRWEYSKDGSVSNGQDAAWIDFISIPGLNTIQNPIPSVSPRQVNLSTDNAQGSFNIGITNIGSGTLNYATTIENAASITWLTLGNAIGSLTANQSATIDVNYNFSRESAEVNYSANLLVDVIDSVITIPVTIIYQGTGIGDKPNSFVRVFPNPAQNQITLELDAPISAQLNVYSLDGRIINRTIFTGSINISIHEIGINDKGIYLFEIVSPNSRTIQKVEVY
ncbi:MAG TPA: M14 family zinc carboxypeptidase [Salinivirgaceae bacterium]|nr:M14 family zinc carboxypeptidase [Salinivirgaceae bacterium]